MVALSWTNICGLFSDVFYKRYLDDTYVRRKKNIRDILFKNFNSYHQNLKITVEVNPSEFLDTELLFGPDLSSFVKGIFIAEQRIELK